MVSISYEDKDRISEIAEAQEKNDKDGFDRVVKMVYIIKWRAQYFHAFLGYHWYCN